MSGDDNGTSGPGTDPGIAVKSDVDLLVTDVASVAGEPVIANEPSTANDELQPLVEAGDETQPAQQAPDQAAVPRTQRDADAAR